MSSQLEVQGVIAAIITPFSDEDQVDEPGLEKLTDYLVKGGIHGIMTTGGTEFHVTLFSLLCPPNFEQLPSNPVVDKKEGDMV